MSHRQSDMERKEAIAVERRCFGAREMKFSDGQPGQFSGYGAVFGNIDSYGDAIQKGAFAGTLDLWKKTGRLPPMLLNHGGYAAADDVPIGVFDDMIEDAIGLKVTGRLIALDTELGKRVYAAMKEGALDGMSIGYRTKDFSLGTRPGEPRRTLKAVDLVEVSVVTFPANEQARVSGGVKSQLTIRDAENALRDAGFSRKDAKTILASGFRSMSVRDADGSGLVDALQGLLSTLTTRK